MKRVLNVIRLQLINRQTYLWVPLIVLGGSFAISLLIYAIIRPSVVGEADGVPFPIYGGGSQAPLWYFLFVGVQAMTMTFPFSQALSITRRDFFLGTMLTAIGTSVLLAILFVLGGLAELATGGWWMNGYFFHLPWIWEDGPFGAGVVYFTVALFFFVVGFTFATIFKTWGMVALTLSWMGVALLLVGLVFLITRLELWMSVWIGITDLGALGLALWGLVVIAVMAVVSLVAFRRTVP